MAFGEEEVRRLGQGFVFLIRPKLGFKDQVLHLVIIVFPLSACYVTNVLRYVMEMMERTDNVTARRVREAILRDTGAGSVLEAQEHGVYRTQAI